MGSLTIFLLCLKTKILPQTAVRFEASEHLKLLSTIGLLCSPFKWNEYLNAVALFAPLLLSLGLVVGAKRLLKLSFSVPMISLRVPYVACATAETYFPIMTFLGNFNPSAERDRFPRM